MKIIILSGKAQSGKNKVASIIENNLKDKKVITISYASYLKEYAKNILKWDGNESTKPRTFLQEIGDYVKTIEAKSSESVKAYRERLEERMRELLGDVSIDEQRLLTETAIFADKIAVDEETVRLKSHIAQLKEMLESSEPVGRKIDFLVQEMNREANTTGSKCSDIEITKIVVEIKSEIEKIREQIQNIE